MDNKRGLILVFMTAVISGISIFMNKFGVSGIDSTLFAFMKNLIVGLFLFGLILGIGSYKHLKQMSAIRWLQLLLVGLIGGSIPFILFFKGLQISTSMTGSLIHKSMFIFVIILAFFFLKERFTWKMIVPAILLFAGNLLLLNKFSFVLDHGSLLMLGAAIFWSIENVISKRLLSSIQPNILAFGRMFFGSIFILSYMSISGKASMISMITLDQLGWILITSAFLIAYVLTWYNGLKHVKVTTATCILLLGSPITTLLSLFSGAIVAIPHILGSALLILGVYLIIREFERNSKINQATLSTA